MAQIYRSWARDVWDRGGGWGVGGGSELKGASPHPGSTGAGLEMGSSQQGSEIPGLEMGSIITAVIGDSGLERGTPLQVWDGEMKAFRC